MLCIFKDHVYGFVFQDDFLEGDNILVADFPIQLEGHGQLRGYMNWGRTDRNFPDCTLANSCESNHVPLLVWLEFLDRVQLPVLFQTLRLVYTPIRPRGYKSKNCILGAHRPMAIIAFLAVKEHGILKNIVCPFSEHFVGS